MTLDCSLACVLPIGAGEWTAYLADRLSGAELPLEDTTWRGSAGMAYSAPSEASIVLDPDYAVWLGRRPELWVSELRFRRDDGRIWTGPIVSVDDDASDGVIWEARDRMELVTQRRWFWRSGAYAGDSANLMEIALRAASYGDPIGLVLDKRLTGVTTDMPVVAGDKIGRAIENLGVPWTVVGDVVRFGRISDETEIDLPADAWGDDRPNIVADGYERLSHVCAVTDDGDRVFFPSADPADRPPGSPLLVDTIDVGRVSTGAARDLARQEWQRRQGELQIVADESRPLTADFPLQWSELAPGVVLTSSTQGRQLTAENVPVRLDGVAVELADGRESRVTGSLRQATDVDLGSPYLHKLSDVQGVVFPEAQGPYPAGRLDLDWVDLGLAPSGEFDPGIESGPLPGLEPFELDALDDLLLLDGVDAEYSDPFADCPPAHCCDQCSTGGGSGGGGGGSGGPLFYVGRGTHDFHDLIPSPIVMCQEQYGQAAPWAPGDLLVWYCRTGSESEFEDESIYLSDEWTVHAYEPSFDAAQMMVASTIATPDTSFDVMWNSSRDDDIEGQLLVIRGAGEPTQFAAKPSDVNGFAGDSLTPDLTAPAGTMILLGAIGAGELVADNTQISLPNYGRVDMNRYNYYLQAWWRIVGSDTSTQETIVYPDGGFRLEWAMVIPPAGG